MIKELIIYILLLLSPILTGLDALHIFIWFISGITFYLIIQRITLHYFKNRYSGHVVSLGFIIMYMFSVFNYKVSITMGTYLNPWILNSDPETYYYLGSKLSKAYDTLAMAQSRAIKINDMGYPIFLGYLFKIFNNDLIWGMLVNLFLATLNIFLIGVFTKKFFIKDNIAIWTMFLVAISPHFLATGIILLKDVFIIFSVLIVAIGSINITYKKNILSSVILIISGLFIIALFRWQYLFIYLFISILIISNKKIMLIPLIIILAPFLVYSSDISKNYTNMDISRDAIEKHSDFKSEKIKKGDNSFVERLVGINANRSFSQKIIRLPLFVVIQFLTPFYVWRIGHVYPYYYITVNLNMVWFLFIGPIIFLGIFYFLKTKSKDTSFKKILFLGIFLYLIPAYTHLGLVPRYATYSLPFLFPFGGFLLSHINENYIKGIITKFYLFYLSVGFLGILFYLVIKM